MGRDIASGDISGISDGAFDSDILLTGAGIAGYGGLDIVRHLGDDTAGACVCGGECAAVSAVWMSAAADWQVARQSSCHRNRGDMQRGVGAGTVSDKAGTLSAG